MLTCAIQTDPGPLCELRPPDRRVMVVCRHFATLFVSIMRHKGVPARARCGFANYFDKSKHTDHWVGEYWNTAEQRWLLVDAQVDQPQRTVFKVDVDTLDVPRDRFLVAGDAWRLCRTGAADPMTFGVAGTDNWGIIEVFGDLFQDLAALQKVELLPWGWYGLAKDDQAACEREVNLIDELASLSSTADAAALDRLSKMLAADSRLRVPDSTIETIMQSEAAAA